LPSLPSLTSQSLTQSGHRPDPHILCSRWMHYAYGVSSLGMENAQQQHANKHNERGCQRKQHCSHHVVTKNIDSHDLLLIVAFTPISSKCSRLRCKQQRVAGVYKGRTRVRFTRQCHELLGELLPTLPRLNLRKRTVLASASGSARNLSTPHKDRCDDTGGCALQQTLQ
jgi:hypothetical protein